MRDGNLNVLALDPGGTTGWACYSAKILARDHDTWEFYNQKVTQGQLGPEKHHLALWNLLGMFHTTNYIIVCESFEYRQDQRPNVVLVSKEYIGVVELFTQERNHTLPHDIQVQHVPQTAAYGKGFWYPPVAGRRGARDGSKLKHLGLHSTTTNGHHINDATAHLLQYLVEGPFKQKQWYHKIKDMP